MQLRTQKQSTRLACMVSWYPSQNIKDWRYIFQTLITFLALWVNSAHCVCGAHFFLSNCGQIGGFHNFSTANSSIMSISMQYLYCVLT